MNAIFRLWRAVRCALPAAAGLVAGAVLLAADAEAQAPPSAPSPPTVTVTAAATKTVANDRLQAWLRAEAESASPAAAARDVNARVTEVLAEAKAYPAVKVATAGYATQQIVEKGKPARWRVTQTVTLQSGDFVQAATLLTRLQEERGMLLSGMGFSISDRARREAEEALTAEALKGWQTRAQAAAQALGFAAWRVGHVVVQTTGPGPVFAQGRVQAMAETGGAPVALEAGTTEVSVTVSGDAVLEQPR
jgi:predicted secreted protein